MQKFQSFDNTQVSNKSACNCFPICFCTYTKDRNPWCSVPKCLCDLYTHWTSGFLTITYIIDLLCLKSREVILVCIGELVDLLLAV